MKETGAFLDEGDEMAFEEEQLPIAQDKLSAENLDAMQEDDAPSRKSGASKGSKKPKGA